MSKILELADAYAVALRLHHIYADKTISDKARAALVAEVEKLEAENAKLKHNIHVLTDALWKSCGDDEETVNATIESQGELK